MKKNAQSVEAWLEAMIAVARYYRLDFSQENVRATVNWERDSKREELLTDMAVSYTHLTLPTNSRV